MTSYARAWLTAFFLTVAVEIAVATPLLARSRASWPRRAGIVAVSNLASHPIVWFVLPGLALTASERLVASEAWAVAIEAATYFLVWPALGSTRAFGTSALANGASLGAGLVLRALGVRV